MSFEIGKRCVLLSVSGYIMTVFKFIPFLLIISCCSCRQTKHHSNPTVVRLSNQIIPLVGHLDSPDSCRKALSFLDSATNIDSECFLCYYNKLMFLSSLKQTNKVLSTVDTCIKLRPNSNDLYLTAALLHEAAGDSVSARSYYTKSLTICNSVLDTMKTSNRDYAMLTTNKAINLIMLNDSIQANEILRNLYNIQPDDPQFGNVEKKYTLSLISKSRTQLIDSLSNSEKYNR